MAIVYHAGQIEVQEEANSRPAATMLAERMGSRSDRNLSFYARADLVVYATADGAGVLRFGAASGQSGLLTAADEASLTLPERIIVDASASFNVSPTESISGRDR